MEEKILTEDVLHDFYSHLDYKKLSPSEEKRYIKRSKLSFYDEVDDDTKKMFLSYYVSEFPSFKREYEKASDDEKEILLDRAIGNSKYYRDEFLTNNQRLVFYVAKDYLRYKRDSFSFVRTIEKRHGQRMDGRVP